MAQAKVASQQQCFIKVSPAFVAGIPAAGKPVRGATWSQYKDQGTLCTDKHIPLPGPRCTGSLTVAGQPFVEVDLSGQHHQLLEVKVHHPDLCVLLLQVLLLFFRRRLLPIWLCLGLPATQENEKLIIIDGWMEKKTQTGQ